MKGVVSQRYPVSYAMDIGRGKIIQTEEGIPTVETRTNEHPQLWFYRGWADWMSAANWEDLRSNHTPLPEDAV
jgi:hypothetical protein